MAIPFASFVTHVFVGVLQNWLVVQSASSTQPAAFGPHFPASVQLPLRQTTAALVAVHVPVPSGKPHLSSAASQTPLTQTMGATAAEHSPASGGVCPATVGTAIPLASFGTHVLEPVSQNWVAPHSASVRHPFTGMQIPAVEHAPPRQTMAAFVAVQGPVPFA